MARRKARSFRLAAAGGLLLLLGAGLGRWAFTRSGLAWRGPTSGGLVPLAAEAVPRVEAKAGSPQRNVVLVSIDSLRADHLGCYGYGPPTTPAIDRFAQEAAVFENAIAQAPSTLPAHASIFTSMLPSHHGAFFSTRTALGPEALTLAEFLKARGFATAGFHGGGQTDPEFGLGQGFDTYVPVSGTFAATVAAAVAWLDETPARPFFLFLHTHEVHHPYTPDPGILEIFDQGYSGALPDRIEVDEHLRRINGTALPRLEIDAADLEHIIAAYDAEIRSMDAAFGTLLTGLAERGLSGDTLVAFTSDHGEEFGEHGSVGWHSHTLYDELLRVPLVIRLPGAGGADGGRRVADLVRGIDVAPTILGALGLPPPPSFEGESVLGGPSPPRVAVSQLDAKWDPPISALRTAGWKLYEDRLVWRVYRARLFDLRADPAEQQDVLAGHYDIARVLAALLREIESGRPAPAGGPAGISPETVQRLRSLGYAE